jgi:hypothetical protein
MDRTRLLAEVAAAQAPREEVLYLERLGEDYRWRFVSPGALQAGSGQQPGEPAPDAWMFYSGPWPAGTSAAPARAAHGRGRARPLPRHGRPAGGERARRLLDRQEPAGRG